MEPKTPYPVNIQLADVREAILGCPEFFEKTEDDIIIFNYRFCSSMTFPSPDTAPDDRKKLLWQLKREARGLIFSKETQKVIARRFHKFFNIGEMPESEPEKIDLTRPYYVLTKYDGQLVTPVPSMGKIRFASKSGFGEVTKLLEERFLNINGNSKYSEFSEFWINLDYTPIFEWCSPRNKIVLFYENDLLILTGIRSNETGLYISYKEMVESANKYGVPVVEMQQGTLNNLEEFQNNFQSKTEIEGVVIKFDDDGTMYKVKTNWYFERSKKEKQEFSLNSERSIWRLILDQEMDDALSFMNDTHLTSRVKQFEVTLYDTIGKAAKTYSDIAEKYRKLDKKSYVEAIRREPGLSKDVHFLLFKLHNPVEDVIDILIDEVKKSCSSVQSLEKARTLLGGKIRFME